MSDEGVSLQRFSILSDVLAGAFAVLTFGSLCQDKEHKKQRKKIMMNCELVME